MTIRLVWAHGGEQELTPEDEELVVKELSERIKDVIFMACEERVRQSLEGLRVSMRTDDSITFYFDVKMVTGDVLQILGRQWRKTGVVL